jgi:glutaredoxin-like protein
VSGYRRREREDTVTPEELLDALDPEQRQAAEAVRGPVVVLAGAGTGKTRTITHRAAYAVRTGAVSPGSLLCVTFTARAAGEMRHRLRQLGVEGVQARTFHAAALRQLGYFWPKAVGGAPPRLLENKFAMVARAAGQLRPGTSEVRDLLTEIEWATCTLTTPEEYVSRAKGRTPPYDAAVVAQVYEEYRAMKADQGVADFDDLRRGAVVALEADLDRIGEAAPEPEQVLGRRAGEGVDRLIGVTHHAQVAAVAEPRVEDALLQRRDVLVLVDDEVPVAALDLLGDVGVLLDGPGHDEQQIGEVELAGAALDLLVLGVDLADGLGGHGRLPARLGGARGVVVGRDQHSLGPFDLRRQVAHVGAVGAQPQPGRGVADEPQRVGNDLGHRAAENAWGEVGELPQRGRVEGARLHPVGAEPAQPRAQLPGGAGGERDGHQLAGGHLSGPDGIGDAVRDRPGLARARTGQDADRPPHRQDSRGLLGVEPRQHRLRVGHPVCHPAILPRPCDATGRDGKECEQVDECLIVTSATDQEATAPMLTMYTTNWCGYCVRLKHGLEREGIAFAEVNIEQDAEAARFVTSVNGGNRTVPTVVLPDGSALTNPSVAEIRDRLAA